MNIIDQTGYHFELMSLPQRIISLVPSQSEFLWNIGIQHERLVGITKFCIHPQEMFRSVNRIGGTKNLNIKKIKALSPDIIIGNKEENEREQIEELRTHFPVWLSDVKNFQEALQMMEMLGRVTGTEKNVMRIVNSVKGAREAFLKRTAQLGSNKRIAYFIWKNPFMVAGKNTFIDAMLNECGFINIFSHKVRYPSVTLEEVYDLKPDFVFLSSEPYPFSEKDLNEFCSILHHSQVLSVNGEFFSWYGSRLLDSFNYFEKLISKLERLF